MFSGWERDGDDIVEKNKDHFQARDLGSSEVYAGMRVKGFK
jgi:hypothetical protein